MDTKTDKTATKPKKSPGKPRTEIVPAGDRPTNARCDECLFGRCVTVCETRHGGLLADAFALHMRDNDAALALPLRNCDIGTPAEQAMRFQKFCHLVRTHSCDCSNNCQFINEPDIIHCQFAWAQMPFKKGGAK